MTADVRERARAAGFALTHEQEAALARLGSLAEALVSARRRRRFPLLGTRRGAAGAGGAPRGVFVHGPAGRGKSWLLDAWLAALPAEVRTRRVHFHGFFDELHRSIYEYRDAGIAEPVARAVRDLTTGVDVVFFDEFHVHDPGDATLLIVLLRELFAGSTVLVASSNYAPENLLPDPLWHHLFVPGIAMLRLHLDTVAIGGSTDLRTLPTASTGFAAGTWTVVPAGTSHDPPPRPAALEVRGRSFAVTSTQDGVLMATFAQLCDARLSTIEYGTWAREYPTWIITDVPPFRTMFREAQQRFINLVDVLCDADTTLHLRASCSFAEFRVEVSERPDAFRMFSRLRVLHTSPLIEG